MSRLERIQQALQSLNPIALEVIDDAADHVGHAHEGAGHFSVIITSEQFEGQSLVARHRLIYEALGELMQTDIHALRIEAKSPKEENS